MRLIELTRNQQITYLDFLPAFNSSETPEAMYRDHIHLSPQGNGKVSQVIGRSLQPLLLQAIPPAATSETTTSE
jgi:lysophospholipase L1-like esterase